MSVTKRTDGIRERCNGDGTDCQTLRWVGKIVAGERMLNRLISAYLAIVFVTGPAICCCAASWGRTARAQFDVGRTLACCSRQCGQCPTAPTQPAEPKRHCPECPCRETALCCAVLLPAIKPSDSPVADWLVTLNAMPIAAGEPVLCLVGLSRHGAPRGPFLDRSDLLDVHHKLRC
jgi:hypothetical protein